MSVNKKVIEFGGRVWTCDPKIFRFVIYKSGLLIKDLISALNFSSIELSIVVLGQDETSSKPET